MSWPDGSLILVLMCNFDMTRMLVEIARCEVGDLFLARCGSLRRMVINTESGTRWVRDGQCDGDGDVHAMVRVKDTEVAVTSTALHHQQGWTPHTVPDSAFCCEPPPRFNLKR